MKNKTRKSRENEPLDLARYGLAYLAGSDVLTLSEADLDRLLEVLGDHDMSVSMPIASTPENVQRITAYSVCRKCGKCCSPDKPNPDNPGVEALEDELKKIASHLGVPYADLESKTRFGKAVFHPSYMKELSFTRYLPLPCPYYDAGTHACNIYSIRPIVCRMHPILFSEGGAISIRAMCDYGKDLIKAALKEVKKDHPEMVMKI